MRESDTLQGGSGLGLHAGEPDEGAAPDSPKTTASQSESVRFNCLRDEVII